MNVVVLNVVVVVKIVVAFNKVWLVCFHTWLYVLRMASHLLSVSHPLHPTDDNNQKQTSVF